MIANNIAEWNGSSWLAFGSGLNHEILALAVSGNDSLYVGGDFTTAGTNVSAYLTEAPISPSQTPGARQPLHHRLKKFGVGVLAGRAGLEVATELRIWRRRADWTTSSYSVTTAKGKNSITIAMPTGKLFFRLSNP